MKIVPINKTDKTLFRGLWEKPNEFITDTDLFYIHRKIENTYHPFADESEFATQKVLDSRKFNVVLPTVNNYKMDNINSESKSVNKLSFTEMEFDAYKRFYGKKLPESYINIEKELNSNNLSHYIKNRKMDFVKRLLHKIKLI